MGVVLAVLVAALVVTVPAWWSVRRPGPRRPRDRVLALVARAWLARPARRAGDPVRPVALGLVADATRLGHTLPGDPRLTVPAALDVDAHPDDARVLARHRADVEHAVADVLRHELGFLAVPVRPVLGVVSRNETLTPGRPRVREAAPPATAPDPDPAPAPPVRPRQDRPRQDRPRQDRSGASSLPAGERSPTGRPAAPAPARRTPPAPTLVVGRRDPRGPDPDGPDPDGPDPDGPTEVVHRLRRHP